MSMWGAISVAGGIQTISVLNGLNFEVLEGEFVGIMGDILKTGTNDDFYQKVLDKMKEL